MERQTITIDASGKPLGRLAVQVADMIRGKTKTSFARNLDAGDFVVVKNVGAMRLTGRKLEQKKYYHHSGFPGGLKTEALKNLFVEHPEEVLKKAVYGMLPTNKLRALAMKRLQFEK